MNKTILNRKELNLILKMIKSKKDDVCFVNNPCLGKVYLPYGTYGDIRIKNRPRGAFGYEHIIQKRFEIDELSLDELVGLIILTLEKVKIIYPKFWGNNRYLIIYRGIRIAIQKNFSGTNNDWIITSYPENINGIIKKEARGSIQSVIDQYRYFHEFSEIRTHVGALTSTINIVRDAFNKVKQDK
ncbi:MAG: hypothetical protein MJ214_01540 [Bacilli bacterium]|nr:hypothetical protein [Bacilli bacterium]